MSLPALKIGLIGFGNIGTGVVKYLNENKELIIERLGRELKLARIADIDIIRPRYVKFDHSILTTDAEQIINDPEIQVVLELIGGIEPARTYIEQALRNKKHVITANKAVLAEHGPELFQTAWEHQRALLCEASVGAGIPIIRSLHQSLACNSFHSISGIMNGTSNYILSQMAEQGETLEVVLKEAQRLGYAEPDPTFDIEGFDTAHKIAILASFAFQMDIRFKDVYVEGITRIEHVDHKYAAELDYCIKLLGIAKRTDAGQVDIRVHPTLIQRNELLAQISGVYNAIMVEGHPMGQQIFYGQGAGPASTASAILGDLIALASYANADEAAREMTLKIPVGDKNLKDISQLETPYYMRFSVLDKPGTMARLSRILADKHISIASMIQKTVKPGDFATLIIITHRAQEAAVQSSLKEIEALDICEKTPLLIRVEE